jgi:hypothetical protein
VQREALFAERVEHALARSAPGDLADGGFYLPVAQPAGSLSG